MNSLLISSLAFGSAAAVIAMLGQQSWQEWKVRHHAQQQVGLAPLRTRISTRRNGMWTSRWKPWQKRQAQERADLIGAELAPALQLVVGQLRVGRGVVSAIAEVADTIPEPLGGILKEVVAEARVGTPIEEVLQRVATREGERHLGVVASAIGLHSRHGGSLVEILESVIETIEEEDRLHRDIRSLTADARLSAVVLLAMPPVMLLFVSVFSPGYASPLVTDPLGRAMSISGVMLGFIGWRWLRFLGNPEVVA